jgi:hypothetical protein
MAINIQSYRSGVELSLLNLNSKVLIRKPSIPLLKSHGRLIFYFAIATILASLTIQLIFPSFLVNIAGLILLSLFIYFVTIKKNDYFGFILLIFILAHFKYAENQGGTINFVAFLLVALFFLLNKDRLRRDILVTVFLSILVLFNFLGYWLKPSAPLNSVVLGSVGFMGYILMFYYCSSLRFKPENMGALLFALFFISVYSLVVALNYQLSLVVTKLPIPILDPNIERFSSTTGTNMVGNSELFGEESLMFIAFCLPIWASIKEYGKVYHIKKLFILSTLSASFIGMLLSRSRSVIIILFFVIILLPFLFKISKIPIIKYIQRVLPVVLILACFLFVVKMSFLLNPTLLRIESTKFSSMTLEGVLLGSEINREPIFEFGISRLLTESWIFGYGWLPIENNLDNIINTKLYGIDLHSLYLSLPFIWGWFGSVAFCGLLVIILGRVWIILSGGKKWKPFYRIAALSFFLVIFTFVLNEYKIGIQREPHYFMTIWIWLGLANALWHSARLNRGKNSIGR